MKPKPTKIKHMKKIGILHGKERTFPEAFVERVNSKNIEGIIRIIRFRKSINFTPFSNRYNNFNICVIHTKLVSTKLNAIKGYRIVFAIYFL